MAALNIPIMTNLTTAFESPSFRYYSEDMHEDPQVPNFGPSGHGPILRKGMTFALEPMVNAGGWRTKVKKNRWTVVTADGSLSAHFEKDIVITDGEAEVLSPWKLDCPL